MSALKAIGLRLGAVGAVLLGVPAAQAAVHLHAPSDWYRGTAVTIQARADADTPLFAFEFHSKYVPDQGILQFLDVLELQNDPKITLPEPIECGESLCNRFEDAVEVEDISAFADVRGATVPAGTVVEWVFMVKPNAPLGEVTFPLFIGGPLTVAGGRHPRRLGESNKQFQVLAIPEPSSWALVLAGLAAVGARAYRRRLGV